MKTAAIVAGSFVALAFAQNQTAAPAAAGGMPAGFGCGFNCVLRPLMYPRCRLATTIVDALVAALAKESGLNVADHPSGSAEEPHGHDAVSGPNGGMGNMAGMSSQASSQAASAGTTTSSAAAAAANSTAAAASSGMQMDMGNMQMSLPASTSSTTSSAAAASPTTSPAAAMSGMQMDMSNAAATSSSSSSTAATSASSAAATPAAVAANGSAGTVTQGVSLGDTTSNVQSIQMPKTNPKPNNNGMSMKYNVWEKRQGLDVAVGAISSLASKGGANLLNVILEGIAKSSNGTASAVGLALSPDVKSCLCSGTPARRFKVAADTCIPQACKAYTSPLPMGSIYIGMINYLCEGESTFTQLAGGYPVGTIISTIGGLQNLPSVLSSLG